MRLLPIGACAALMFAFAANAQVTTPGKTDAGQAPSTPKPHASKHVAHPTQGEQTGVGVRYKARPTQGEQSGVSTKYLRQ